MRSPKPVARNVTDNNPDGGFATGRVSQIAIQPGFSGGGRHRWFYVTLDGDSFEDSDRMVSPLGVFVDHKAVTVLELISWAMSRPYGVRVKIYLRAGLKLYHRAEFTEAKAED
jgi:hypothetical protein